MKPVFVTGGTGLVGSHLIHALTARGEKVRATHRRTSDRTLVERIIGYYQGDSDSQLKLLEWIECDITDYGQVVRAMEGSDYVYHCAAAVSFEDRHRMMVIDNNVAGTVNIVNACIENKVKKLCHVSSNAALGAYDGESMVNEAHEWDEKGYRSPYGLSKYLSEQEVFKGIRKGLNAVIVNPTIILGPGDWNRGSVAFFARIDKGMRFYTCGTNGYVDVNDVVKAMMLLAGSNISGERFILNSENLDYGQFFRMISESLGIKRMMIKVPKLFSYPSLPLIHLIELLFKGRIVLTKEMVKVAWSRITYDNGKIRRMTGFEFTPVERTVQKIAQIYLEDMKKIPDHARRDPE